MGHKSVKRTCNDLIMSWRGSRGVKRVGTTRGEGRGVLNPPVVEGCVGGKRKVGRGVLNGFNGIYEWITKLGRLFPRVYV